MSALGRVGVYLLACSAFVVGIVLMFGTEDIRWIGLSLLATVVVSLG